MAAESVPQNSSPAAAPRKFEGQGLVYRAYNVDSQIAVVARREFNEYKSQAGRREALGPTGRPLAMSCYRQYPSLSLLLSKSAHD